jgi:hypothetical protein
MNTKLALRISKTAPTRRLVGSKGWAKVDGLPSRDISALARLAAPRRRGARRQRMGGDAAREDLSWLARDHLERGDHEQHAGRD